jgi:2-polyprenyl-6-methoxyphenol hydroxylase-like FAD-dependent oxidoreductase
LRHQSGDIARELQAAFEGFHPEVRSVLKACPECHKWAILERDPLPNWSNGRIVLLGNACHPMTPYMGQGAVTSIEDAVVLSRCIATVETDDLECAFRRYEANRKPRTSRIQAVSSANTWLSSGDEDPSWLCIPLAEADRAALVS